MNEYEPNYWYNLLLKGDGTHTGNLRAFASAVGDQESRKVLRYLAQYYRPDVVPTALVEQVAVRLRYIPEIEYIEAFVEAFVTSPYDSGIGSVNYLFIIHHRDDVQRFIPANTQYRPFNERFDEVTKKLPAEWDYIDIFYRCEPITELDRRRLERSPNVIFRRERQTSNEG